MSTHIFGVRILLEDHMSQKAGDADVGLYNVEDDLAANASSGQSKVEMTDSSKFTVGTRVKIIDDTNSEECTIEKISSNDLYMVDTLTNSYTLAANAQVIADSEFRWVQNAVPSLSESWCDDMLVDEGIGKIVRSADMDDGGGLAKVTGLEIVVKNTESFWYDLMTTLDISLIGYRAEVVYFTDTTETVLWYGICEKPKWDRATFTIPLRDAWKKRNANITEEVNVTGKTEKVTKPVTFGKWNDFHVKLVQTDNTEDTKLFAVIVNLIEDADPGAISSFPPTRAAFERAVFPVVAAGSSPSLTYDVKLGSSDEIVFNAFADIDNPVSSSLYMKVTEDTNSEGAYRRVTKIAYSDAQTITVTVAEYFTNDPANSATGDGAWVSFVEISKEFVMDSWKGSTFLSDDGDGVSQGLDLYVHERSRQVTVSGSAETVPVQSRSDDFIRLPQYAYDESGDGNNNKVSIVPALFDDSVDTMNSFLVKPMSSNGLELCQLSLTDYNSIWGLSEGHKYVDGLYADSDSPTEDYSILITDGALANVLNNDHTSLVEYAVSGTGAVSNNLFFALNFELPTFPDDFEFDNAYIGIMMTNLPSLWAGSLGVKIFHRRFLGSKTIPFSKSVTDSGGANVTLRAESILDQYYSSKDTDNIYFYPETDNAVISGDECITGYTLYPLAALTKKENYNAVHQFMLQLSFNKQITPYRIRIYALAVIFKKRISIGEELFTFAQGRVADNTWADGGAGRVAATLLLDEPRFVLEHLCRLQNWSEGNPMPTNGWGLGYAERPRINTGTGTGGFGQNNIVALNIYEVAAQFKDYDNCWTEKLKQSLCREMFLVNYVDGSRQECVMRVPTTEDELETPDELISFSDVRLADSKITIREPDPQHIYPEPFVRYNKNMANGEYESIIKIKNVTAGTFDSSYVEAPDDILTGGEAEALWDKCVELYEISGIIHQPPASLTDMQWANGGEHAHEVAKNYLDNWINWMRLKHIDFSVHFLCTAGGAGTTVRTWNVGQRFRLQLPHETNDAVVECIVDQIVIDPNPPYHITVGAFMLETAKLPEGFYIKKTYDSTDPNWAKTYDAGDTNLQKVY